MPEVTLSKKSSEKLTIYFGNESHVYRVENVSTSEVPLVVRRDKDKDISLKKDEIVDIGGKFIDSWTGEDGKRPKVKYEFLA